MSRQKLKRLLDALDRLDDVVIRGGGKRRPMKKKGNWFLDLLERIRYRLGDIDTGVWYKGKVFRSSKGRFRSASERRIARLLDERCVKYKYEDLLVLDNVKLHPDFHLLREGAYLEFWGMPDDEHYAKTMEMKKSLYRKHNINVISLYPQDMENLDSNLARLYQDATGKEFPSVVQ